MQSRKVPPFGKFYFDLIRSQKKLPSKIFIACGKDAWRLVGRFSKHPNPWMMLPAYECPGGYLWPIAGADVYIFDTGFCEDDYLNDFAFYLYGYGAKTVYCILPDFEGFIFENTI